MLIITTQNPGQIPGDEPTRPDVPKPGKRNGKSGPRELLVRAPEVVPSAPATATDAGALTRLLLLEKAAEFALTSRAPATLRAYVGDWQQFEAWCGEMRLPPLPAEPQTVCLWLAAHADTYKTSTLTRKMAAIAQVHKAAGHADPPTRHSSVQRVFAGIRRQKRTPPQGKVPLLVEELRRVLALLPDTLLGKRDRLLLLLGFSGAFRRSEVSNLDVSDVRKLPGGLEVSLRGSKTDQEGKGQKVAIPKGKTPETCPVAAYEEWRKASGIRSGPLFRGIDRHGNLLEQRSSGEAVAIAVKRAVARAGLDANLFAGHSLRAGLATSAALAGASDRKIMAQTRHKSRAMLERYIRDAEMWRDNAAAQTGL